MQQNTKPKTFDLSKALLDVIRQINQAVEQQTNLYKQLVSDLNINARQKLKHYKKILESGQKQNLAKQKQFINKYLKSVFLVEYLVGNTQNKPALLNLLNKLRVITYPDIIAASKQVEIREFSEIKTWSEIVDLISRIYAQKITKEEFLEIKPILTDLQKLILQGEAWIDKNEFKSKWLATFTQILRTENLLVRCFSEHMQQEQKSKLITACRTCISRASSLSKQVISQSYLLLLYLSPQQPTPSPQNHLCLIHYHHAFSIVNNTSNIRQLISLIPKLKQTQHKCQLLPLLEQSFIQHYKKLNTEEDRQFRNNVFDQVINLFEVGRSIYGYLETIVKVIIQNGDHWNMEGNFVRKFFISTIVLKILPTNQIIQQWPTILQDIIVQCGNMSVPYANQCAKILFQKLYQQNQKDYLKWSRFWMDSYKLKLLDSNEKGSIRGIIQFINPILLKVCPKPFLLKELLALSQKQFNSNLQLGIISLIRCYKEIGQIQVNQKDRLFQHSLDKDIKFTYEKIRNFLLSNDEMIAFQALQLVCYSLKPSQEVKPMQMNLCIEFYQNSLKTSMPEYRKNYLAVTKKLFDRLRNIYDSLLVNSNNKFDKKNSKKLYYTQFVDFLKQLIRICFRNVFPEVIFQLINPALQILQLIQNYFGNKRIEIKKGIFLEPSNILKQTCFYDFCNFENLLSCLQSSYESVRQLAHDLLNEFNQLEKKQLLLSLWQKSLQNTNKLAIRSYEYACRILTYISDVYPHILNIQKRYELTELNILNYFLNLTRQRYGIFKDEFIKQGSNYYNNLVHGLLTIFSYQIEKLSSEITNKDMYQSKYAKFNEQIKQFLTQFFTEIMNMLNFAVEISSSNVSTVVLDTLTQGSQTDKKLKIDCRGHFLQQQSGQKQSNIGTFLESTALISSMEDDEEGIQNTLVVSFYLLTRQAGLVFQSIGGLLSNDNSSAYIPIDQLIKLINTYFYALVNLKHMGSVDRISKGLGKMARVIFDHESKQLSQVPQTLLNKLLNHLKSGNFTNILRRSAGVPFAFCCLLKSESLKRNKLIQKSVTQLLTLSRQNSQNPIELRIHALNIMKKLFQDSDLKSDLDPYVSDAFISSIKGFTSEQWGVRNSSLMLFTTLSNRTVGIKPTYNLLQFFIKCPSLLEFIQTQLHSFTEASLNTMYPPLYPIVLLFSRLLPFDLKEKSKIIPQNSMKHIRKEELLSLLPILDKAGLNHNYMGRVMTAKAILPFMEIDQIHQYCVNGITDLVKYFNQNNNMLHYQLTKYYNLLTSYQEICKNSMKEVQINSETLDKFWNFISLQIQVIAKLNCPVVLEGFLKIFHYFFESFNDKMVKQFGQSYEKVVNKISQNLRYLTNRYVFDTEKLVIFNDLGHSMMRKECISFDLDLLIKYRNNFQAFKNLAVKFTYFLSTKLQQNQKFFQTTDNQIIQFYLQKILQNIESLKPQQKHQLFTSLTSMLTKLELNKIRSDIIINKVLQLRKAVQFKSLKIDQETKFLLTLECQSNNHFLKISIFKYLVYTGLEQSQIIKILMKFSDPNSLEELRYCSVQYLQTIQTYNQALNIVCVRLLQDEEYEIRKQTAIVLARQLKIYQFNQTVIKNEILKKLSLQNLSDLLSDNSDFKIKRKNHEEERIFSYDKPNKFRSDITTLFEILLANQVVLDKKNESSKIFNLSLTQAERKSEVLEIYKNDIISRTEYQFQLVFRQLLATFQKKSNNQKLQNQTIISEFHPLFKQLIETLNQEQ